MYKNRNLGWFAATAAICSHTGVALSETSDTPFLDGKDPSSFALGLQYVSGCQLLYEDCNGSRDIVTLSTPLGLRAFYEKLSEKLSDEFLNLGISKPYGSAQVQAVRQEYVEGHLAGLAKDFVFDKWKIGNFIFSDAATVEISLAAGRISVGGDLSGTANAKLNSGTFHLDSITLPGNLIPSGEVSSQTFTWPGFAMTQNGCSLQYSPGKLVTPLVSYKNSVVSYSALSLTALNASWLNCKVTIDGHTLGIPGGSLTTQPVSYVGRSYTAPLYKVPLDLALPTSILRSYAESISGSAKTIFGEGHLAMAFNKAILSHKVIATFNPCAHVDSQVWWGANIGMAFGPSLEGSAANPDACLGKPFIAKQGWAGFANFEVIDTKIDFAWNEEVIGTNTLATQGNTLLKSYITQGNNLVKEYTTEANTFLKNYAAILNGAISRSGQQVNIFSINAPFIKSVPTITGSKILNELGMENPLGITTWALVGASYHKGRLAVAFGASEPINPSVRNLQLNGMIMCQLH